MIKINDLQPPKGAVKEAKRVGRGNGSGHGKTAGRGHKGALARSGSHRVTTFEGGQMPIIRRLPSKGFTNALFRIDYNIVNVRDLSRFENGTEITPDFLREHKLVRRPGFVKLLGDGEIRSNLIVKLHKASKQAIEKLEAVGGKFEEIK